MDILILAAGLGSRLSRFTHDIIPKYLINLDNNTGLYYLITYWNKYANNIYLVINSKYNKITRFYINNILNEYSSKIKIINYDTSDGTAYTLNYILNNDLKDANINNLLLTWCDLYPVMDIDFNSFKGRANTMKESQPIQNNNIFIFTNGNKCRYNLDENNKIVHAPNSDGNIIGIYYFQNYKTFTLTSLEPGSINNDIVSYLDKIGNIYNQPCTVQQKNEVQDSIIDYGDEDKLLKILDSNYNSEQQFTKKIFNCRYFNNITIIDDNKLYKEGITDKGKEIIQYEKNWYNYLYNYNQTPMTRVSCTPETKLSIAGLEESNIDTPNGFLMEYKKDHIPLYKYFRQNFETPSSHSLFRIPTLQRATSSPVHGCNAEKILDNIIKNIDKIHNIEKIDVSEQDFFYNLNEEIYNKLYKRKEIINDLLDYIGEIKIVNNIKIDSFDNIVNKCKKIIFEYYNGRANVIKESNKTNQLESCWKYSIILGDCQFSNILINPNDINDITFIDPRGYFGNSKIHGPPEYDYAKVLYGISGYDNFNADYFNIKSFDQDKKQLDFEINEFQFDKNIINKYFDNVHHAYLVIIWLSLAEYNKNNIWKCLASYYHGLYLGTRFFNS